MDSITVSEDNKKKTCKNVYLSNGPDSKYSKINSGYTADDKLSSSTTDPGLTCSIYELSDEIIKIRNLGIEILLQKYGLSLSQAVTMKTSAVDLVAKKIILKSGGRSTPQEISLSDNTVSILTAYFKVRSPSKEKEFFLLEKEPGNYVGMDTSIKQLLGF